MKSSEVIHEKLDKEVEHMIEEARMILPGIQALFGFQLIAVFNERFAMVLPRVGQLMHLASLILIAIAIALIMAPAAYHRQAERGTVSQRFSNYASRLITLALCPLSVAIPLEVGIVAFIVTNHLVASAALASLLFILLAVLWFVIPRARRARRAH